MSTYTPIQSITLSADTATIDFTGIPQTYTDLVLVANVANNQSNTTIGPIRCQVGGDALDTGSNYSTTFLIGELTSVTSTKVTNNTFTYNGECLGTIAKRSVLNINFQNYANTSMHKTMLTRHGTENRVESNVSLWRNTSAIKQIRIYLSGSSFISGSTFTLYGIQSATTKASGGEIYVSGGYAYHVFKQSGQFVPIENLSVDYLVIAGGGGGGGGGNSVGAGGGGGGYRSSTSQSLTTQIYPVLIGGGGNGGTENWGANGNISSFNGLVSAGGGGGAAAGGNGVVRQGLSGGSGGGSNGWDASGSIAGGVGNTPSTSPSQGNNGGSYTGTGANRAGAGGGGAGAVGGNASGGNAGTGGNGSNAHSTWATATNTGVSGYYAGGGGGSGDVGQTAAGGAGGGGAGSYVIANSANGTTNTGGGGGGAGGNTSTARSGGSGIVIVRYAI
jgi:hypothetical protein